MKLADWARKTGISYTTAWRWVKDDIMPVPWHQTVSGTILVDEPASERPQAVALYARVNSHDQRADLDRQLARLSQYAAEHGLHVSESVAEVGSGLNGNSCVCCAMERSARLSLSIATASHGSVRSISKPRSPHPVVVSTALALP